MALYDEIRKNFILPNAYEDWKEYRDSITGYVIDETNQISVPLSFSANMEERTLLPTLAIIGAGACNDFDLQMLHSHFSKITLLDSDTTAMETALETYNLTNESLIECKTTSLNGLQDSHYAEFCNHLQSYVQCNLDTLTPSEFESYAISLVLKYLESFKQYEIPLPQNAYDYICCFGVHSQLQAMFSYIYRAFEMNLRQLKFYDVPDFSSRFTKCLQAENEHFIPRFHDALLACAKQGVFLGLEQKRTNDDGAIEGAYQAVLDIQKRNLSTEHAVVIWPFLPEADIAYEMSIFKITI